MNAHTEIAFRLFHLTVPALASYITRVGAKEKNFRNYVVQEEHGHYHIQKCAIRLAPDGTITCDDPVYDPTEAEREAIKAAFAGGVEMPRSIEFRPRMEDLMELMRAAQEAQGADPNDALTYFEFYNQKTGLVQMVQQRIETEDGKKYLPWAFFNDAKFRCMEVDGALPFWKPKVATDKPLMVHEGAKSAAHVSAMCEDPECNHPWIEELRKYEHWGMIGGALSPHRADYKELEARKPDLMVYVCDNDWPGKSAAPIVSKNYLQRMKVVEFDGKFPPHWDMADKFPEGEKRPLKAFMRSGTFATKVIKEGKKSINVLNPPFAEEWMAVADPDVYVHVDAPNEIRTREVFDKYVRPYSQEKSTSKLLDRSAASAAAKLGFDPTKPSGKGASTENGSTVNTHVGAGIKPVEGDCAPWEEYLAHTFPDPDDRKEVVRWVATFVCRPDIKIGYAILLISETQGIGKSTLGEIIKRLIGEWNCAEPNIKTVAESQFNSWAAHKRCALIHEVYEGHQDKSYERFKSLITEPHIDVNKKYQAEYRIANWLHVIACSNSKKALKLDNEDRRWLVPRVSENTRLHAEWAALHAWLNEQDGYAKILWWLQNWLRINDPVARGAHAPDTTAKREVVLEGLTKGQELVARDIAWLNERRGDKVVFDTDWQARIIKEVHNDHGERAERPAAIRKAAKAAGWFVIKARNQIKDDGPWYRRERPMALTNNASLVDLTIPQLMLRAGVELIDVRTIF